MIIGNLEKKLSWEVEERPIYDHNGNALPRFKGLFNNETEQLLHVVSNGYKPVTNAQMLENIELLTERTGLELMGFESFKGGAKVMAFLTDPTPRTVGASNFATSNFMVMGNSNDYTNAFFTGFTNHVHRCENMFSDRNQQNRIAHTADSARKISALMRAHEVYYDSATGFFQVSEKLERVSLDQFHRDTFTKYVFEITDLQDVSPRKKNQLQTFADCIKTETAAFGENLLGLFQGATRYVSRELKTKNPSFGNLVGHAAGMNARAFEYCKTVEMEHRATAHTMHTIAPPQIAQRAKVESFLI